ncbi:MAG TPA: CHAT domain-containing tetratricopeptide repeat protein [Thermoanaerobaculia bacterium]|nr:CHAT domain-containing tetratricopeptide repeat protein [Thermoanaerobaculia bacterium]
MRSACVLLLAACHTPGREWPAGELRSGGRPVAATISVGEFHRYRLPLQKGSLLRLVVDQQGSDVLVAFLDPSNTPVLEVDRLIGDRGPELVLAVAERSGDYAVVIRAPDTGGSGRYAARIEALRPASAVDRRSAEAYRSFTGAERLEADEAMKRLTQALATWRELGEVALEAEALERIARFHRDRGKLREASALYRKAAAAFGRAGDRRWEALALTNAGSTLFNAWEAGDAAEQYGMALSLARRVGDRTTEATALHGRGQVRQQQGELQGALDDYRRALELFPPSDPRRPYTLHQLGVLYTRSFHDESNGRKLLLAAHDAWKPGQESDKARTSSQLGRLAYEQGRLDEARRYSEEALRMQRDSDPCGSAVVLLRLALVEDALGARPAADARRAEALRILAAATCLKSEPTVYLLAAGLAEKRGDPAAARAGYHRCASLFTALGDRMGLAECLEGVAGSERSLGDLETALAASRRALDIFEGVRPTVLSEDLRLSFFSGARQAFELQIDLLLGLGAEEEAWATAEEARARVLQDLLAERGAGLRRDAAPGLVARERALQRQLNLLETRRQAESESRAEKLQELRREIDAKIGELESLRGEIRRGSPRYASLTRPGPVSLATVRRELLDADTVLLEYHLGETASTVWAVTGETLAAVRLPPRSTVETVAREATHQVQSLDWPRRNPEVLCELSRMLLGPVAPFLGHRRLVVVADGALEALSFAALPVPGDPASCPAAPALVDGHEIAYLPSAATLLAQRRLLAGRQPAPGWLAVVADPVYGRGRLPGTAQEAAAITAGLPAGKVLVARGPAASRQTVTGGSLHGFRILHIAAHGVLDSEQPLLSALALSERDAAGRPVPGTLPAHEIYDLDLPAELVVLSACETARGREVPGEGLVSGLPRAFLHAGAARVLVSLWEVEDQATRDLMVRFYRGLLGQSLPPAQALAEAQRSLREEGRPPSQWAGFVLLGDWRPLPPFSS